MVPILGLEPRTYWLQVSCSTNWAKSAWCLYPDLNRNSIARSRFWVCRVYQFRHRGITNSITKLFVLNNYFFLYTILGVSTFFLIFSIISLLSFVLTNKQNGNFEKTTVNISFIRIINYSFTCKSHLSTSTTSIIIKLNNKT